MYNKAELIEIARSHCIENHLSASAFARVCGVSETQMKKYFRGEALPGDKTTRMICDALGMLFELIEKDASKSKPNNKSDKTSATTKSSRAEADRIIEIVRRIKGYKYTADTTLVIARYIEFLALTIGLDNLDFSAFEKGIEKEAYNG